MKRKKSGKGKLVKGYIPSISRDFLEFSVFRDEIGKMLKGNSGVYVLYKKNKLYYVGIAGDLFWRLHQHTKDKHKDNWDRFSVFIIAKGSYLKDIESMVHRISETKANVAKGKFKAHYEYDKKIKNIVREISRKIRKIQKSQ